MQIVRVVLALPRPAVSADAELINDLLWDHFPSSSGVAHITTIALGDRINITIFLNSSTENPAGRVMALLRSIPKNSTGLSYWVEDAAATPGEPEER